ncbi:hypothetical protein ES332_A13G072900v1 [Gossypium tomentosum]|uniref:Uncharacterized protein n=1 Tax=Gossypium tomentosum TaxID=34277 RepID=A0A5D2MHD1_GOSTO|nr:hypothetical protein ES332_A13G072900v1 [Gossypium tomentosum]
MVILPHKCISVILPYRGILVFLPYKGDPKFCPTTMQIAGSCGPNGVSNVLKPLMQKFPKIGELHGASAMAQRCSCKDLSANEHLCQCYIVCQ